MYKVELTVNYNDYTTHFIAYESDSEIAALKFVANKISEWADDYKCYGYIVDINEYTDKVITVFSASYGVL